jgi:hypothetical protein
MSLFIPNAVNPKIWAAADNDCSLDAALKAGHNLKESSRRGKSVECRRKRCLVRKRHSSRGCVDAASATLGKNSYLWRIIT